MDRNWESGRDIENVKNGEIKEDLVINEERDAELNAFLEEIEGPSKGSEKKIEGDEKLVIDEEREAKLDALWEEIEGSFNDSEKKNEEDEKLVIDEEREAKLDVLWEEIEGSFNDSEKKGVEEEKLVIDEDREAKLDALWEEIEGFFNDSEKKNEEDEKLVIDEEREAKLDALWEELKGSFNDFDNNKGDKNLVIDREREAKLDALWEEIESIFDDLDKKPKLNENLFRIDSHKESSEANLEKFSRNKIFDSLDETKWYKLNEVEKKKRITEYSEHEYHLNNLKEPLVLRFKELNRGVHGGYRFKSKQGPLSFHEITINTRYLKDSRELANTISHEVHHAYQTENEEKLKKTNDPKQVDPRTLDWLKNEQDGYISPSPYNWRKYAKQPLEKSAFEYGEKREKEALFDYSKIKDRNWDKLEYTEKEKRMSEYFKYECKLNNLKNLPEIQFEELEEEEEGRYLNEENKVIVNAKYLHDRKRCVNIIAQQSFQAYQFEQIDKFNSDANLDEFDRRTINWVESIRSRSIQKESGNFRQDLEIDAINHGNEREKEIFKIKLW
ncbi:hypothetical protein P4647_23425 [Peribacillus frigoritolerans]|uniref:hypothetical protein n=1 Tax=Peribacillus frigoritolerans TaxID=450367 RepID=UPI002E1D9F5C|nr:hypothetical protein [Peribacillus frigoritolerans]